MDAGTDVGTRVVLAIADAIGVDPLEMDDRLVNWVDPDALEALVRSIDSGCVQFTMRSHRIRVAADGRVFVDDEVRPATDE